MDQIQQRQRDFLDGKFSGPLLVFPEGTITSGKHVIKFKKGAFNSLLPLKPLIINTVTSDSFHHSVGSAGLLPHYIHSLCYLWHVIEVTELPVMTPNEHMYDYYSKKNPNITEKWEIFAEVARDIICECSHMDKSEMTYRDSCDYANTVNGKPKKQTASLHMTDLSNESNISKDKLTQI